MVLQNLPPAWVDQGGSGSERRPYKVLSLFSGCGGMDLGFTGGFDFLGRRYERLPFEIVWANELNANACRTYRRNLGAHIVEGDVWKVIDSAPAQADVVIGGFPCQDVSVNGKGAGVEGARTGLYRAMVELIRRTRPTVFVAENVKGLLTKKHQGALRQIRTDFESLGYQVDCTLYRAHEYGVPQTRERVLLVGTKAALPPFRPPAIELFDGEYVTATMAIDDLAERPPHEAWNHVWSAANKSPEQGNRRLLPHRPGYTIRAECHGNIQFHYRLDRRISMREAARLQSFPDSFVFDSKLRETERQVGNAVPPVLAWHVARQVAAYLRDEALHGLTR